MRDPAARAFEPGEGGLFDDGFGEGLAHTLMAERTSSLSLQIPGAHHH